MKKMIVVIGGGLAGSLLCNELVKSFDVTLLERGPRNKIDVPRVKFINKAFAEVPTFCYGGGGTTNLWHNGLIPINTKDITNPVFRDVLENSRRFMDQAASALYFSKASFRTEYEKLMEEINAVSTTISLFPHGIDCLIYPKQFGKITVDRRVCQVYGVQDIDFVFEGQSIHKIGYRTHRLKQTVSADAVIICAGTLGTPVILQKILSAAGLPDNAVAFRFIDHPMGFVGKVKFTNETSPLIELLSTYDKGEYISRNAVRLKSSCGKYTACAYFRPALTMANNLTIYKFKSSLGASYGMVRFRKAFSPRLFHPDILAEVLAHIFGVQIPGRTYNILFVGEQKHDANRVFYKGNQLHVEWCVSQEELVVYRQMLRGLYDMLKGLADEINIQTDLSDEWFWSMAHHSGTTSMGDTDDALVDRDLRLRRFKNAYVCDGSVIQEHSYANTGLAIGQLAFRLAERIQQDVQG